MGKKHEENNCPRNRRTNGRIDRRTNSRMWLLLVSLLLFITGMLSVCGNASGSKDERDLTLWYTEEAMKSYLENAAKAYEKETGIAVKCLLRDSKDYMDDIHNRSLKEEKEAPDLYLLRHDRLGRACMQGNAATNVSDTYSKKNYCKTALEAASYQGKLMAYPLYYNTACMLYNTDYFKETPVTMGAITAFSETAEIGENVQNILYWDINDYFCNYPFIGAYVNIDENSLSDDENQSENTKSDKKQFEQNNTSIVNDKTANCLQHFQDLGQYFAIDSESISREDVPAALMEGRTLCILANSDMVHVVNWYAANYGVGAPYQISTIPDVSDDLKSCEGSYTELVVVNGMSLKQDLAADFAEYITCDYVQNLYDKAGHFPAKAGITYENAELSEMYGIYEQSKPFPKLIETEDLGVSLEVLFSNVWEGSDIATELKSFAEKIELRLNK